jgi:glycosyltransferase involved in cell wall biosynthesis
VRIALLGGIFGDSMQEYSIAPLEAVLRHYFVELGHEVVALSTHRPVPFAEPVDVYHGHHFGVGTYDLALSGARPLVFTPQNPFLISDFGTSESRADHMLQQAVFGAADAVVLNSQRELERLARRFRLDRSKVSVIPSAVKLDLYGPGEAGGDTLELLAVGQLVEYKGHGFLLRAVAELAPARPELRLRIVTHQRALEDALLGQARELGIAERITIEGPLATPELARRYGRCDVFVHPSLAECFPTTVMEAMASGRPVVATDVGGVPEQVGDAGLIVPPRDAAALAQAIERLLVDPDERRRLGEAARERALRLFSGRGVAEEHVELYGRLLGGDRRPWIVRRAAARAALAAYERKRYASALVPESLRRRALR